MISPPRLAASSLVIIWFANDRWLIVSVLFIFVVVVVVVVGIARRHRVEDDGNDAPIDQTGSNILGDVQGHVGSCWMSRHPQVDAIRVAVGNKLHPPPSQSRFGFRNVAPPPAALPAHFLLHALLIQALTSSRQARRLLPTGRLAEIQDPG